MGNLEIDNIIEEKQKELDKLKLKREDLEKSNKFVINTNSSYLLNMKVGNIFTGLKDWAQVKWEQCWKTKKPQYVRVTFEVIEEESKGVKP